MLSTYLTEILLFIVFVAAGLAVYLSALAFSMAKSRYMDVRDFREMRLFLADLDDRHEALVASHKRLRSRVGMKELRAKRKQEDDIPEKSEETPEQWKKRKRLELHSGRLKP